jgi:hypothetical protein
MLREGQVVVKRTSGSKALRAIAWAAALLCMGAGAARADDAGTNSGPAATLSATYAALKDELSHNQFNRPLHLDSSEGPDGVRGEIFAIVNYPFATAGAALNMPSQWCDILILHLNTKYCRPATESWGTVLHVSIGKKYDQPVSDAYRLNFAYRVAARTANYLHVKLNADQGPLGTRDYRIVLEAAPTDDGQTFIRLSYAYSYGMVGQLAMRAYLNTIARDKVGFTVVGGKSDGPPQSIGGIRGVVERNTMRYYLAIEAFLGAQSVAPKARVEKSQRDWFAATEAFPRQLHEMEQGEYLAMKRVEYSRQQTDVMK